MFNRLFYFIYNFHKTIKGWIFIFLMSIVLIILAFNTQINIRNSFVLIEILTFPFQLISKGLQALALINAFTNIIALIIFIVISSIPILIYIIKFIKYKNDYKNPILSGLFYSTLSFLIGCSLYLLINPSLIKNALNHFTPITSEIAQYITEFQKFINIGLIHIIYCFIFIFLSFRFFQYMKENKLNLFNASKILLIIQKIAYVILYFIAFYFLPLGLNNNLSSINHEAFGAKHLLFLAILKYIYLYIILIITCFIFRKLHDLLSNFKQELLFENINVLLLQKTALLFIINLIVALSYQIIQNGYQILFSGEIQNIDMGFTLPVTHILLALVFNLLSLLMSQSYKIYKEHRLTI